MSLRSLLHRYWPGSGKFRGNASPDKYQSLLEKNSDVICHFENYKFTYISPSAKRVFGWNPDAMLGQPGMSIVFEEDRLHLEYQTEHLFSGKKTALTIQFRVITGDGSPIWCEALGWIELKPDGEHHAVVIYRDISERKRIEDELSALALQDGLTGLANRRAFDLALEREWKRTLRDGGEMALLMLDVDFFKQFNDTYGHQAGDDCLRMVAACVQQHSRRPGDVACRYGGEEIVVILSNCGLEAALVIANTMRMVIMDLTIPNEHSTCGRHVTVSIGVASAIARTGGSMRMPESLLHAADRALYEAKANGRNRLEGVFLIAPSENSAETVRAG